MIKYLILFLIILLISSCALYYRSCDHWSIYSSSLISDSFDFHICSYALTEKGTIKHNESEKLITKANEILSNIEWEGSGICKVTQHRPNSRSPGFYFIIECEKNVSIENNYTQGNGNTIFFVGPKVENKL